ncbi:hypothetical protein [Blastococcus sp. TF02-8]|uniref:hypothetical protein n=1 Tax=Blastococcus sp. TF02-8 TaxID=2250574 RepID=UPI00197AF9D5|nr:hypothetical protein [Blastococcus sp. TF02-8]
MTTLQEVTSTAATLIVAAGVVSGLVVVVVIRRPPLALGVLLDMLVAAGLLRLVGTPGWPVLATTAVILLLRRVVSAGFRAARHSWSDDGDGADGGAPAQGWPLSMARLVHPAWRR